MHITYISSYVPRKCGIATYTRDLAVESQNKGHQISIVALENLEIPNTYSDPVTQTIRQQNKEDYTKAAKIINSSSTEMVHLQHEFGLFGGVDGNYLLSLAGELSKPFMVTFHTILINPTKTQKKVIQELGRLSRKIIVMDKIGKDRLENIYGLSARDITIILHGAPIVTKTSTPEAKIAIGYPDRFIMLANNLLSRNKGIEYAVEAVSNAVKDIPSLLFLVIGETHPLVKKNEGESYRNELMTKVDKLGLKDHVIFKNEYVSQDELKTILSSADVYITPYLDPEQVSSGTLSYAIGAGKACIATEYVYAKEMLSNGKGIIVPFRDSSAIAEALVTLYQNPAKKELLESKTSSLSKDMSWSKVSGRHLVLYKKVLLDCFDIPATVLSFIGSSINISYLIHLTNTTGVVQHANTIFPDLKFGYSTCDNSRALIVASQIFNIHRSDEFLRLIKIYSEFLSSAQEPNGKFHNFLNSKKTWDDQSGVNDAFGRALWGLGFHLYAIKNSSFKNEARALFEKSLPQLKNIIDLRTAAYTILGLYYYILACTDDEKAKTTGIKYIKHLGENLIKAYQKNHKEDWEWFEDNITYDNFRLPQALFAVFLVTGQKSFKDTGEITLKFITKCNFDFKRGYYDFIGQDGWYSQTAKKADYDQQPLEAAGAVEANIFASIALDEKSYITEGLLAYEWFFGNNRNHRSMYDISSKGVADGLTLRGISANQGAESIICFLMSSFSLQENKSKGTKVSEYFQRRDFLQKLRPSLQSSVNLL